MIKAIVFDIKGVLIVDDEPVKETIEIVKDLAKKFKIYYLSNKTIADPDKDTYHFLKYFDGGIFSHEVGLHKPDIKIYHALLDIIPFNAKEMLFIDDRESNLVPARQLSLKTILFTNPKEFKKELIKLNVV